MSITAMFFLIMNKFAANPFQRLMQDHGGVQHVYAAADGRGLNPLLQHPAMVIHPPMLYTGYVGMVVPFAFCMAALLTRELGSGWIKLTRRWTLFAWIVPGHRHSDGRALGLRRAGLGRLLGLGSGGERLAHAVAHRHRVSAQRDRAGAQEHAQDLERRPDPA